MLDNIILYLFLGIFAGVFFAILCTVLGKFLKGTIRIKLLKKTYHYGEEIKGTFSLHAKKAIKGEDLSIHLIGYTKESSYSSKGQKNTRQVEFTRFSKHVESNHVYDAGMRRDYDISVKIPNINEIFTKEEIPNLGDGMLGKLAKYALTTSKNKSYSWEIRIDLEAEGLDLSANKQIFISREV